MTAKTDYYRWQKMMILVTNKCNLKCTMCSIIRGDKFTLTEEQAMHCADFAERRGFEEIEISGGEPTLVEYFWRLLDKLCENEHALIKVTTNALRLKDEQIQTLASYSNLCVQVSFDGVDEVHDTIRAAKGAFHRSEENLIKLAEAGCKNLSINTVVMQSNYRQMAELYERFKDLPLTFHAFSLLEDKDFCPQESIEPEECDEFMEILSEVKHRADRDGNDVILSDDLLDSYRWRIKYPYFVAHPGRGCTVTKKCLAISHRAYAIPCIHYPHWDFEAPYRSLREHTLDEIVDCDETRAEIDRTIGPGGCLGCSTMCYNWDVEFREKVMAPKGKERVRKALFVGKEYLREKHPTIFGAAKRVRSTLRT